MDPQQTYKLEEMRQLRAFISVLIQEISKVEIFTVTSIAAVVAFYLSRSQSNPFFDEVIRFGPIALTAVLAFKAYRFADRIRTIDEYLYTLEQEFRGGWIYHFRERNPHWRRIIIFERMIITTLFVLVSIYLAIFTPFVPNSAKSALSNSAAPQQQINPQKPNKQ